MTVLLLVGGLAALVGGAELLVRGASRLALALRIPPLIVGLTVVAFGTSAPELAVSTGAALSGETDIAIGNVVGSNVFNVLLILGLSAVVAPLHVASRLVRLDVPVMIGVSLLLLGMAYDGRVGRGDGVILLVGMLAYLGYLGWGARRESAEGRGDIEPEAPPSRPATELADAERSAGPAEGASGPRARALDVAWMVAGLVLLILGSDWLVDSARTLATRLGVSELVIGLTVVAAGTSLPELATSLLAAARGQRDIAVGNVVGSNIFNVLAILGVAATVAPSGLAATPAAVTFDIPVMTVVAVVCLPVFFSGGVIARWEGALFVGWYVAYVVYLALDATGHGALPEFRDAMLWFVLPLTALTVFVVALGSRRRGSS